jgi:xanthosine utilization system XapX-like protein
VRRLYVVGAALLALALVAGVAGGVLGCVTAMRSGAPGAVMPPLMSTVVLIVGVVLSGLLWRVLCEYLLAVFQIRDAVAEKARAQ